MIMEVLAQTLYYAHRNMNPDPPPRLEWGSLSELQRVRWRGVAEAACRALKDVEVERPSDSGRRDGVKVTCAQCHHPDVEGFEVGDYRLCYRCWNCWLAIYGGKAAHARLDQAIFSKGARE